MKKYLFMAVAAIAVLSSCSNDDSFNEDQQSGKAVQFTATLENDATTRTTLDGNNVNWASGDEISVNGSTFTTTSTSTTGTFTGETAVSAPYTACYPSSMYDGGTITLPASYTYSEGQFNMPMYAQSTTTKLGFQNICGVLAIKVTSEEMSKVTSITVTSKSAISGACTINGDGSTTKYYATCTGTATADKTVTLNCGTEGVTPASDGTVFYLPLPVLSGATLYVTVNGDIAETKASSYSPFIYTQSMKATDVSIARNTIYAVTFKTSLAEFSVSSTYVANFTNGNLWSNASGKLSFESSQTAYPTTWNAAHVGHFFWTVNKADSYCETYPSTITPTVSDTPWFASGVTVGSTTGLRTLSKAACKYLITTRGTNLYKHRVTVGSAANCLIIAPDNFVGTLQSSYETEAELKAYGLVCLPAAGSYSYYTTYGLIRNNNSVANYWLATPDEGSVYSAYNLYFNMYNDTVSPNSTDGSRSTGNPIRLVKQQRAHTGGDN